MIIPYQNLQYFCESIKRTDKLIVTNGIFNLLGYHHCKFLKQAKSIGGLLLVGINSDETAKKLKGENRYLTKEEDRAYILNELKCVDFVTIFAEKNCLVLLDRTNPDFYCKGGDYSIETINQDERRLLERMGTRIEILSHSAGYSTTNILNKTQNLEHGA